MKPGYTKTIVDEAILTLRAALHAVQCQRLSTAESCIKKALVDLEGIAEPKATAQPKSPPLEEKKPSTFKRLFGAKDSESETHTAESSG